MIDSQNQIEEVFIVSGLPRSGTSMMMRILKMGGMPIATDLKREADEDNPRGYFEVERVRKLKDDSSWVPEMRGTCLKVVSTLLYYLPQNVEYKIIFMLRNIDEIILSQRKMLTRMGEDANPAADRQIKRLFEKHIPDIKSWLLNRSQFKVLYLDYRTVVESPGDEIYKIPEFLDMDLNIDAMTTAIEPSLYRNRRQ